MTKPQKDRQMEQYTERNTLLVAVPLWEHAKFPSMFHLPGTAAKRVFLFLKGENHETVLDRIRSR